MPHFCPSTEKSAQVFNKPELLIVMFRPGLGLKAGALARFWRLGLFRIPGQAVAGGPGLARPGFGLGRGFSFFLLNQSKISAESNHKENTTYTPDGRASGRLS